MINEQFIVETLRQHQRYNGQKQAYIDAIRDECVRKAAFDYAAIQRVVQQMIGAGQLPESESYREVFDFFWTKHPGFGDVQSNENILVQDLESRGQLFLIEYLEAAWTRLTQQNPETFQHNQQWHDEQARQQHQRYENKQRTALGQQAAALEAELLQGYRDQLQSKRSKQEARTQWTDRADAAQAVLVQKEQARLAQLSFEDLQAEKAAREQEKAQRKASVYVPGLQTFSEFKPIPDKYEGEPWTMRLLSRLGGIGTGQDNRLRRIIRAFGADAINKAVRENAKRGIA